MMDCNTYNTCTYIHIYMHKQYTMTCSYFQRMEIAHQLGDRLSEARAICNIGNALRLTGSPNEAQKCYLENLECSREIGDLPGESIALLNLGTISESLGDLDKASSWYTMVRVWRSRPHSLSIEFKAITSYTNVYVSAVTLQIATC